MADDYQDVYSSDPHPGVDRFFVARARGRSSDLGVGSSRPGKRLGGYCAEVQIVRLEEEAEGSSVKWAFRSSW